MRSSWMGSRKLISLLGLASTIFLQSCIEERSIDGPVHDSEASEHLLANTQFKMGSVTEIFEADGDWVALHDSIARVHAIGVWRNFTRDGVKYACVHVKNSQIPGVPSDEEICRKFRISEDRQFITLGYLLDIDRATEAKLEKASRINNDKLFRNF